MGAIASLIYKKGKEPVSTIYDSLWEIQATDIDGKVIERLGSLVKGKKAVLVVNVATK